MSLRGRSPRSNLQTTVTGDCFFGKCILLATTCGKLIIYGPLGSFKGSDTWALDAKGLALCGLALCACDDGQQTVDDGRETVNNGQQSTVYRQQAIEAFQKARKIAPHAGVVKSVLRLFDELVKCDKDGVLKGVREVIEGTPLVE